jgi:hypothetical protein
MKASVRATTVALTLAGFAAVGTPSYAGDSSPRWSVY